MTEKCMVKPVELECFQWFSNAETLPNWFQLVPDWFVQHLNNGDWVINDADNGGFKKFSNDKFKKQYQLIEERTND